ncbi:hypothetical protein [Flammeovirga sp. SubArs3]|uniref:hypothetical protein n=1 Tax=Flammeovirga sp. SubArs3 TaxID=2995316 RepID=UPI00248A95EE|nr:hypothetical protein [Flammeovirga sp. SubArs3]
MKLFNYCILLSFLFQSQLFAQQDNPRLKLFYEDQFFIKGAGIDNNGPQYFQALKNASGNAFRTWRSTTADAEFDSADKYNLKVALGIEVGQELHGFDYNDSAAIAQQFNEIKEKVLKYKDEKQLLCWVVGNELNLLFKEDGTLGTVNPKVYNALENIVQYIHSVDSIHPVTTTFAGIISDHVKVGLERTPSLDFISFQVYGDLSNLPLATKRLNLSIPFIISEYGPLGHWERPTTKWGREIEETSTEKAKGLRNRIKTAYINQKPELLLGSFAFLWGNKQERTPTWYGMFLSSGECDARVDELTYYWSGEYPENRAPEVNKMTINNNIATDNITVSHQLNTLQVEVETYDHEGDELVYKWELLGEVKVKSQGGAFEQKPEVYPITFIENQQNKISIQLPKEEGEYRLFVYVFDQKGKVGTANVPFLVTDAME